MSPAVSSARRRSEPRPAVATPLCLKIARLGEVLALEVGEAGGLAALEGGVVADLGRDEQGALHLGDAQHAVEVVGRDLGDVDAHDRAEAHQLLDVVDQAPVVLVQSDRVADAGEPLEDLKQVVPRVIGLDLEHRAVGADRAAGRSRPGSCGRSSPRPDGGRRASRARCRRTPRPEAPKWPSRPSTDRRDRPSRRSAVRNPRQHGAHPRSGGGPPRPRNGQEGREGARRWSHLSSSAVVPVLLRLGFTKA